MPMPKERLYTVNDIYALPEGQRAELVDGVMYGLAAPSRIHQKLVHFFDRVIGNHIAEKKLPCEVYPAPFAVFLENDEYNYVEPDISIICDQEKLKDDGCHGAPDWIIEIVSPGSISMDYLRKLVKYRSVGVRLYWIVDPGRGMVSVYDFENGDTVQQFTFEEDVPVGICEGFSIRVADYQ